MAESTLPHRDAVEAFVDRVEASELDTVERMYLFGSVARGDHTSDSDIDVFAVVDGGPDIRTVEERLRDIAYDVMLDRGTVFSIHAVDEQTLERRSEHPFFQSVLDEGQPIMGERPTDTAPP